MDTSLARLNHLRLPLALTALAFVQLACFTSRKTVIIRADGAGEVRVEAAVPAALMAEIEREETSSGATAEGWTDIAFTSRLTADPACPLTVEDQTTAITVFEALMPVFAHPNCANCHGAVTDPYAQDTNHPGGTVEPGRTCDECHVQAGASGPGSWRLAPPELGFAGRTAEQICTQVKGFHTSANGLIGHLESDPLIGFGFAGESAGAADQPHPLGISRGEALALATAWRDALGAQPDWHFWPGGQSSACGCALVEPAPATASGILEVISARYPFALFSPEVAAAALTEFTTVEYSAVDQVDGSVVYSFRAVADMTEIQQSWDEVVQIWTVEGLDTGETGDGDPYGLLEGTLVFTPEEIQAMIDTYGEPLVEIVVVLPGDVTQAAAGWANAEDLLAGASDSATFTWRPGDPAVSEVALVRVARPPGQEQVEEQRELDPDSLFEFSMALPWDVPVPGAQTPGEIVDAAQGGNAPPSALTQIETLRLLDAARRSGDPNVYNQLDGLTYAPVQLSGLEHKGVVVFPTGTDWRITGVVLDPWIAGFPTGIPIAAWAGAAWLSDGAVAPEIDPSLGHLYPQGGGGAPGYPPDIERDRAAPPPVGSFNRSLFARGPVSVLVILPDGRHIGETTGGGFINHLRGEAEMFKRSGPSGSFDWWTFLPLTGYRVEIYAQDAGILQVDVGGSGFEIADLRPGEILTFTVSPDGTPGQVTRTGGSIPSLGLDGVTWLIAGFACMLLLGLALMVVSGVGLVRRGRSG